MKEKMPDHITEGPHDWDENWDEKPLDDICRDNWFQVLWNRETKKWEKK